MDKMINKVILIVIVLTKVSAKINIDVQAGVNNSDVIINYTGVETKIVTEFEIDLFGINEKTLTKAVETHFGRKPSNVYVKSPTPWGDLYRKYHWEQVTRVLYVKSARVVDINQKPSIIMTQDFENKLNNTIKVNAGISQTVENTVSTVFSKNKEISVDQEIEYDFNFVLGKLSGKTGFSFTSSWGESEELAESTTIGSTTGVEVELRPKQAITAVLSATKGHIEVEIVYIAKLRGNVAVNFKKTVDGHHFWGPTVQDVMESGGINNEFRTLQTVKLGFYSEASLKVYDKVTGRNIPI